MLTGKRCLQCAEGTTEIASLVWQGDNCSLVFVKKTTFLPKGHQVLLKSIGRDNYRGSVSSEKTILKKCLKGVRKEAANTYNKYTVRRQNVNP